MNSIEMYTAELHGHRALVEGIALAEREEHVHRCTKLRALAMDVLVDLGGINGAIEQSGDLSDDQIDAVLLVLESKIEEACSTYARLVAARGDILAWLDVPSAERGDAELPSVALSREELIELVGAIIRGEADE